MWLFLFILEKAQYEAAMSNKHGPNRRTEHPNFDASVIYECVGRMTHGKLGISDEAALLRRKKLRQGREVHKHTFLLDRRDLKGKMRSCERKILVFTKFSMLCG